MPASTAQAVSARGAGCRDSRAVGRTATGPIAAWRAEAWAPHGAATWTKCSTAPTGGDEPVAVHVRLERAYLDLDETVAFDKVAAVAHDRARENRAGGDECVELAVLAAGVDARGKLCEQLLVVVATGEAGVEGA